VRMRLLPLLAASLLGASSAGLVACGGGGEIPSKDASSLERTLDTVASEARAGNCTAAQDAVAKARGVVVNLPDSVNARLRARLNDGLANLTKRVSVQCQAQAPATTQPEQQQPQTSTEPTGTATTPTETTPTDTQPQDTTGTPTTPPPTTGTTTPGTTTPNSAQGDGATGGTSSGQGGGG
jgi:hypothetical protein